MTSLKEPFGYKISVGIGISPAFRLEKLPASRGPMASRFKTHNPCNTL